MRVLEQIRFDILSFCNLVVEFACKIFLANLYIYM